MTGLSSPITGILGTMGALPTTDRGRRTRQRIVAAATEVVAEKGALGASLDEVGARALASRSQLYHYFDDKNDLLLAVAEATNDKRSRRPTGSLRPPRHLGRTGPMGRRARRLPT